MNAPNVVKRPLAASVEALLCALGLVALAAFYLHLAPRTVQGLDAGELVAGAYNRTVVHPPGYPVWLWLTHAATHATARGTVFYRAAVLNISWAVLALGCITAASRRRICAFVLFVVPLACQQTFCRYALLPDVFMLHGLLVALVCLSYMRLPRGPSRQWLLACLVGLGLAHHQTFVFVVPLALRGIGATGRTRRTAALFGAMCAVVFVAYASLLLMQPGDLRSWGDLHSWGDFMGHVLRRPYGTFRLAHTGARVMPWVHWWHLARLMATALPAAAMLGFAVPLVMASRQRMRRLLPRRFWWLWCSMGAYVALFFVQVNQTDTRIVERFMLMPIIGYSFLAAELWSRLRVTRKVWLQSVVCVTTLSVSALHLADDWPARNVSRNTIVEDYAQNLLRMAALYPSVVLLVDGDTPLGALRYVQHVQHMHEDVVVLPQTGPAAWQLTHLTKRLEHFILPDTPGRGIVTSDLMSKLIEPNEPAYTFLCNTTRGLDVSRQKVVYMGLGRRLQMGMGRGVDVDSLSHIVLRSTPEALGLPFSPDLQEDKVLFASYAAADFVAGKFSRDPADKKAHFARALGLVSYCLPAAYELCVLDGLQDDAACRQALQTARAADAAYF